MNSPDDTDSGFFSRWSRRKAQVRHGGEAAEQSSAKTVPATPAASPALNAEAASPRAIEALQASSAAVPDAVADGPVSPAQTRPRPTLDDVEQLDASSDYRNFVARDVDPEVRNAAFKKLFHSDPHFNVMDGLDVYIDDYNTPQPLSLAVMKTLVQARAMGLIDDELKDQDLPPPDAPTASPQGEARDEPGVEPGAEPGIEPGIELPAAPQQPGDAPTLTYEPHEAVHAASNEASAPMPSAPTGGAIGMASAPERRGDQGSGKGTAPAESSAEIVHVLHLVPSEPVTVLAVAPAAPAAAGIVVPFPRRPGSADPT